MAGEAHCYPWLDRLPASSKKHNALYSMEGASRPWFSRPSPIAHRLPLAVGVAVADCREEAGAMAVHGARRMERSVDLPPK